MLVSSGVAKSAPTAASAASRETLGKKLHRFRNDKGISLRALAKQTDFSPSFISQVEHDQVSPSIASLEKIAAALGITLAQVFQSPGSSKYVLVRANERENATSHWSKAVIEGLGEAGCLDGMVFTLGTEGSSGNHLHTILYEQFVYVLTGELTLEINDEVLELETGDAITLPPRIAHRFVNRGPESTQILLVTARCAE